ncbi:excisionase family DNA-binding protein [Pseudomonas sp. R2.Fl]|nr:excisionase family DNA-binding protein [Pseudomonas sp. R2.Fl]
MDEILTTAQAAKLLGVSVRTAQLWVESGDLASWKTPGGHRRIPRAAVAELIAGQAVRHPSAGATALVLARAGDSRAWDDLAKAGLMVEVVEDALQAAVRVGELLPSLIIIDAATDPERLKLLNSVTVDALLAPSLVVARAEKPALSDGRGVSDRRCLVFDSGEDADTVIASVLDHLKRREAPAKPMKVPYPLLPNEGERLRAVEASGLLHSPREECFDRLVDLGARMFDVQIAMFTLLTSSEQWFKSKTGFDGDVTPREWAFCNYTLVANEVTVLDDLANDPRFADNPTIGDPYNFRFYAGAPVRDENGFALGSICIIDRVPRDFGVRDQRALATLADAASIIVKWRAQERELRRLRAQGDR